MYNSNVVDVFDNSLKTKDNTKKFTQDHVEKCKQLINRDAYPEYFGDLVPKGIVVEGKKPYIDIIDNDLIDWENLSGEDTQYARVGGKNPDLEKIRTNIKMHGYKLRNIPIMILKLPNGRYRPINGRSRKDILMGLGFSNCICIVYEVDPNLTQSEIDDLISQWGLKSNAENDPAGDLQMEDVVNEGIYAIQQGWVKITGNDREDFERITKRVESVCGKGIFTRLKRDTMASRIFNSLTEIIDEYSERKQVIGWNAQNSQEWLRTSKLKDIEPKIVNGVVQKLGIKYFLKSASTGDRTFIESMACARDNPNYEIRVSVHTGILKGYSPTETYVGNLYDFRKYWKETVDNLQYAYNSNIAIAPKVVLYGALPSCEVLGDTKELVKFKNYTVSSRSHLVGDNLTDGLILKK